MYSILNKRGAVTGYVVGDYYLTPEMARMFFDNYIEVKPVCGVRNGNIVHAYATGQAINAIPISASNYYNFLSHCITDKADLHNLLFIPCRYSDFDWWKTNSIWKVVRGHLYKVVTGVNELGYMLVDKELYPAKFLRIAMIEVVQKGRGHGSRIIDELKSRGKQLSGISTVDAESFWEKHGAIFDEGNRFTI